MAGSQEESQKIYLEGWKAYHDGTSVDDNPYDGWDQADWDDGWYDARAGRDPVC